MRTIADASHQKGRGGSTEPFTDLFSVYSRHWSPERNGYEMNEEFEMDMANISSSIIGSVFTLIKSTTY